MNGMRFGGEGVDFGLGGYPRGPGLGADIPTFQPQLIGRAREGDPTKIAVPLSMLLLVGAGGWFGASRGGWMGGLAGGAVGYFISVGLRGSLGLSL